jgi:hypothetical protein
MAPMTRSASKEAATEATREARLFSNHAKAMEELDVRKLKLFTMCILGFVRMPAPCEPYLHWSPGAPAIEIRWKVSYDYESSAIILLSQVDAVMVGNTIA